MAKILDLIGLGVPWQVASLLGDDAPQRPTTAQLMHVGVPPLIADALGDKVASSTPALLVQLGLPAAHANAITLTGGVLPGSFPASVYALALPGATGSKTTSYKTPVGGGGSDALPAGWSITSGRLSATQVGAVIDGYDLSQVYVPPGQTFAGCTISNCKFSAYMANVLASASAGANGVSCITMGPGWKVLNNTFIMDPVNGYGFQSSNTVSDDCEFAYNDIQGHAADAVTLVGERTNNHHNYIHRYNAPPGVTHIDTFSGNSGSGKVWSNFADATIINDPTVLTNFFRGAPIGASAWLHDYEVFNNVELGWSRGPSAPLSSQTTTSGSTLLGIAVTNMRFHDNVIDPNQYGRSFFRNYEGVIDFTNNVDTRGVVFTDVVMSNQPGQTTPAALPATAYQGTAVSETTAPVYDKAVTVTYQWVTINPTTGIHTMIAGATSASYTPAQSDVGTIIGRWRRATFPFTGLDGATCNAYSNFLDTVPNPVVAAVIPALKVSRVQYASPTILELPFNADLNTASVPAASAFAVTASGGAAAVSSVAATARKVKLTLGRAIAAGETISVAYTPPGSNQLQNAAGTANVAAFSGKSVANGVSTPQQAVKFAYLRSTTESQDADGGYDYAATSGTPSLGVYYNGTSLKIPAGADGFFGLKQVEGGSVANFAAGLAASATNTSFTSWDYGLTASGSGTPVYKAITAGVANTPTPNVVCMPDDIVRFRRTGTTVVGEVTRDEGTTWTTIRTWTGDAGAALYGRGAIGDLSVTLVQPFGSPNMA